MQNEPYLWERNIPVPKFSDNKYSRGQVMVLGGMEMTGAACLSALAASRAGAGLTTIVSPTSDFPTKINQIDPALIYRSCMPHLIVREGLGFLDYLKRAELKGECVSVIGPGMGGDNNDVLCKLIQDVLRRGSPLVLDADGLNSFEWHTNDLFFHLHQDVVLTPHEGEFLRLFPDLAELLRLDRIRAVQEAVVQIEGTIVLKGAHTLIACKGREIIINNEESSPYLATAGSGDVLAGLIAGLRAQGMPLFEASCAAVWMHGRAAKMFGAGLIATDLPDLIPKLLQEVLGFQQKVS